jgi:DNA polymerase-3 subunit gamma/tau
MPLHIDYRPDGWDQFVGNEGAVAALRNVLGKPDRPHSYLFQGPTGCGKTTLARIMATELGCDGRDLVELNAAEARGIDAAREIISRMQYKPGFGKVRVFILDEAHRATVDFQNALLKPMEEPPVHVYFALCTTEPDKVLKTIRGRCSIVEVRLLTDDEMAAFLDEVAGAEGQTPLPDAVMDEVLKAAQGHPRDALVLMEQVLGLATEPEMLAAVRSAGVDERQVIELCRALLKGSKWSRVADILAGIDADPEKVRRAVLGYCSTVLLGKDDGMHAQAALVMDCFREPTYDLGRPGIVLACYEAVGV